MDIGVIFPQTELGYDTGAVRAVGQAVSDLGYTHLAAYDHVLGGDTAVLGNLGGPYGIDHPFREPLTMFSYLAGFTNIGFATSILIGPQRQTALLAKQAVELDLLCGGRFRLGLGVGWQEARVRRARHAVQQTGCAPRGTGRRAARSVDGEERDVRRGVPPDRPRGARTETRSHHPGLDRRIRSAGIAARWSHRRRLVPDGAPAGGLEEALQIIRQAADEAGRDLTNFQFEGRLEYSVRDHDKLVEHACRWREAGATHLSLNTMHSELKGADAHIAALEEMAPVLQ